MARENEYFRTDPFYISNMSYQVKPGEAQESVRAMITEIITVFDQTCIDIQNQTEFDTAVNALIDKIFEIFKITFLRIRDAVKFKNIFLSVLRSRQDELLLNSPFGNAFSQIRDIHEDMDIDQNYLEAVLIHCDRESIRKSQAIVHYLMVTKALLQAYDQIRGFSLNTPIITQPDHSLFKEALNQQIYLDILKEVTPPITDQTGEYILGPRSKGAVVAWIDILKRNGKINNLLTPDVQTALLNHLIPGLNINKRSLGNMTGRAYIVYQPKLEHLIKKK